MTSDEQSESTFSDPDDSESPTTRPSRKRVRVTKAKGKRKSGRTKNCLKRLLGMPPEVFNEVILHLTPPDLLALARSNKFFRNILMSRSSARVWKSAIGNVQGLPPCPVDLTAPQYVSLIYSKTCSECGARVLRRMDTRLRVRLCNACRDSLIQEIPWEHNLRHYLPISSTLLPEDPDNVYHLKRDFQIIFDVAHDPRYRGDAAIAAWQINKWGELQERYAHAKLLEEYLDEVEEARADQLSELKEQRIHDIESRLLEEGWTFDDMDFPPEIMGQWSQLLVQPKALTERVWTNLRPKLFKLLQTNREKNEQIERQMRLDQRRDRLHNLFSHIRNSSSPFAEITVHWDDAEDSDVIRKIETTFPTITECMGWPCIKAMVDADTTGAEMELAFEQCRDKANQLIDGWSAKATREIVENWKKGRTNDVSAAHLDKFAKMDAKALNWVGPRRSRRLRAESPEVSEDTIRGPVLPRFSVRFFLSDGSEHTCVDDLSDDMRLLLRADTIFRSSTTPHYYYPQVISAPPNIPDDFGELRDSSSVMPDNHVSNVASMLLKRLDCPDASHAELETMGNAFISHYSSEITRWDRAQTILQDSDSEIVFNNTHDLSVEINKPIIKILDPSRSEAVLLEELYIMACQVCEGIGLEANYVHYWKPAGSALMNHLQYVHEIVKPVYCTHYHLWRTICDNPAST